MCSDVCVKYSSLKYKNQKLHNVVSCVHVYYPDPLRYFFYLFYLFFYIDQREFREIV